jgi:hypothetical protein
VEPEPAGAGEATAEVEATPPAEAPADFVAAGEARSTTGGGPDGRRKRYQSPPVATAAPSTRMMMIAQAPRLGVDGVGLEGVMHASG